MTSPGNLATLSTMNHSYFRDKVSAYHDRELPAQELALLEEHIRDCGECQALLSELERLDQLVSQKLELGDGSYWEKSAQKIEERLGFKTADGNAVGVKRSTNQGMVWKITSIAASIAVLFFIALNKDDILKKDVITPSEQDVVETAQPGPDSLQVQAIPDTIAYQKDANASSAKAPELPVTARKLEERSEAESAMQHGPEDVGTSKPESGARSKSVEIHTPSPTGEPKETEEDSEARVAPSLVQRSAPASMDKPLVFERSQNDLRFEAMADEGLADSVSAAAAPALAQWRSVRDSLAIKLVPPKESLRERFGVSTLQKPKSGRAAATAEKPVVEDQSALQARYIEACFEVARLTTEASEYTSAVEELDRVAGDVGSPNAALAGQYLTRLKTERPSPPPK